MEGCAAIQPVWEVLTLLHSDRATSGFHSKEEPEANVVCGFTFLHWDTPRLSFAISKIIYQQHTATQGPEA